MTDTLGATGLPPPPPQQNELSTNLDATVQSTPELASDPASAVAVAASGGNVVLKGQGVAHSVNQAAKAHVAQQASSGGGGIFGDIIHGVEDIGSKIGSALNKPLQVVQHEYRYLHDVEARHGAGDAFLEGLGLVAGAAVGGAAGLAVGNPFEGAALGAEGAAALEGSFTFKDSWARTANGNTYRDPHTGQLVSFGRDLEAHIGGGKIVSGAIDGIADLAADPVALVGKAYAAQKTVSITAEGIDRAWVNPLSGFKRAATDIAGSDAATITRNYPQFKDIALELEAQKSPEEVRDFMKSLVSANELMSANKLPTVDEAANGIARTTPPGPTTTATNLPSLSPLHVPLRAVRNAARDAGYGGFFSRHIMNNAVFGPGRWADRLEYVPGNTFSKDVGDLTGNQFDPGSTDGINDVMSFVRFSSGETAARAAGQAMYHATEAQRVVMYRNIVMKTLFHMARVPDELPPDITLDNPNMEKSMLELVDGKTKDALVTRLESHMAAAPNEASNPGTEYGFTWSGDRIKPYVDDEGNRLQGAITPNQRGFLSIPNITEARRMAAAIRQAKTSMFLGNVDDFFYDHVTQGLFKPLVLMSGGYALHIALAELIPNTLRHGVRASVGALRTRALAKLGYDAADAEVEGKEIDGITGWLYRTVGARGIRNSQDAQYMIEDRLSREGAGSPDAFASGEALQGEIQPTRRAQGGMYQEIAKSYKTGKRFYATAPDDPRFADNWHAELAENVNRWSTPAAQEYKKALAAGKDTQEAGEIARQAVAKILRQEEEQGQNQLVRSIHPMDGAPPSWDGIDGHAQAIVDKLQGAVHGRPTAFGDDDRPLRPGPVNQDLLDSIANGRVPTREEVHSVDAAHRPLTVKGRDLVPVNDGLVQTIANFGFRKLLNPMVNVISRNQEYTLEYLARRRELQPLVDSGVMSEDQAMTKAQAAAIQHGLRFVHNLKDRTQWTATMRNWVPFYFAQEQAYRRMGRLLVEDPGAFRRYQLMISGVHNLAATLSDGNGDNYIAFPGSGFLGTGVAELMGESGLTVGNVAPAALGGSFSSANVIFPLSQGVKPDLGPLVIVPAAQLSSMFSELGKNYASHNAVLQVAANELANVAGSQAMSESLWEQLIPNATAQRVLQAALGDDRAFNSAVMQSYQFAMYQQAVAEKNWIAGGKKGPEPEIVPPANATAMQKQQFQDKIRNYTRMLFFVRALDGFISPVSSTVVIQNLGIPQRLQNYITSHGSVALGMQAAHLDHPEWDPWMVSQSYVPSEVDKTQASGYSLASSIPAQEWVTQNQGLLDKYGVSAMWLMPQLTDTKYSPTIYNEQIAQGLRIKDTPDQFLAALYVNAGNNLYYAALTIHEDALAAAGNSSVAKNAEYDNWNNYVTKLEQQNPVWAEDYLSANKQLNRTDAIKQLTAIFNANEAPPGPMSSDVEFVLNQYYLAASDYQVASNAATYSSQLSQQKAVRDNWINYMDQLETQMPQLKPIIQGVFKEALDVRTS